MTTYLSSLERSLKKFLEEREEGEDPLSCVDELKRKLKKAEARILKLEHHLSIYEDDGR
jgi:hypothetical protein